jgi:hypothetical protein
MKAIIVPSGGKSDNGYIYPKEVLESSIKKLKEDIDNRRFMGELKYDGYSGNERGSAVNLSSVSHIVTDIYFDNDDNLVGEIEILETPRGKDLKEIIDLVSFRPRGMGNITEDKKVENYIMISVDAISKESSTL